MFYAYIFVCALIVKRQCYFNSVITGREAKVDQTVSCAHHQHQLSLQVAQRWQIHLFACALVLNAKVNVSMYVCVCVCAQFYAPTAMDKTLTT